MSMVGSLHDGSGPDGHHHHRPGEAWPGHSRASSTHDVSFLNIDCTGLCREMRHALDFYLESCGGDRHELGDKAAWILARAQDTFDSVLCPPPPPGPEPGAHPDRDRRPPFSLWAFYHAQNPAAAVTTGANVFHTLLVWCRSFPDGSRAMNSIIDISEALGSKHTAVMLAFGLYGDYRPPDEMGRIIHELGMVAQMQPLFPPGYLAQNCLLDRIVHQCAALRAARHGGPRHGPVLPLPPPFPSPGEVSAAVLSCLGALCDSDQARQQLLAMQQQHFGRTQEGTLEGTAGVLHRSPATENRHAGQSSRSAPPPRGGERAADEARARARAGSFSSPYREPDEEDARSKVEASPYSSPTPQHLDSAGRPADQQQQQQPLPGAVLLERSLHHRFRHFVDHFHEYLDAGGVRVLQELSAQFSDLAMLRQTEANRPLLTPPYRHQARHSIDTAPVLAQQPTPADPASGAHESHENHENHENNGKVAPPGGPLPLPPARLPPVSGSGMDTTTTAARTPSPQPSEAQAYVHTAQHPRAHLHRQSTMSPPPHWPPTQTAQPSGGHPARSKTPPLSPASSRQAAARHEREAGRRMPEQAPRVVRDCSEIMTLSNLMDSRDPPEVSVWSSSTSSSTSSPVPASDKGSALDAPWASPS